MGKSARALVMSDSHGDLTAVKKALDQFGEVEYIFHLGDYASDAEYIALHSHAVIRSVRGNCDYISPEPYFEEIVIAGQKIILTHGHKLNAKYSLDRLYYYAVENGAKAMLYGHTHIASSEFVDGVWLVNPGSVALPREGARSVALLMIGEFGVVPKIIRID